LVPITTHLDRHLGRAEQAPRQRAVVALPKRAVEIDEVHPARAVACELARHGHGIVGVRRGVPRLALAQAHHAPALHVNGGVELHGGTGN